MQEKLQTAINSLKIMQDTHHNYALEYSYKAICENRFAGEEKYAQSAKENALIHDGSARGIGEGIFHLKSLLQEQQ